MLAGFEGFSSILDRFIKSSDYKDNFTRPQLSEFFRDVCNKFLHSYGQNFGGRKDYSNYNEKQKELFTRSREYGFFEFSKFIVDSGAFQVSVGLLTPKELDKMFDLYYQFVQECKDCYDLAFILDLPLGPECQIENTSKKIYQLNYDSYHVAANLPDDVRKKIVYIHHFRTPKLWDIYTKIMDDGNLFDRFDWHATGGMVANASGDMSIPCIIYVIPLIPLINRALKSGRKILNFHILGVSTYRDMFFYEMFKKLVYKKHDLILNITFDSSTIFKGVMVGRKINMIDGDVIRNMDLRTEALNYKYNNSTKRVIDLYNDTMEDFCNKYNFTKLSNSNPYDPSTGTFFEETRCYLMLYVLYMFNEVEKIMKRKADELFPVYESGDSELFSNKILYLTRDVNSGKLTRKQTSKTNSLVKSLVMLSDLDEDYCKHLVYKFLAKDEFIDLDSKLLKF